MTQEKEGLKGISIHDQQNDLYHVVEYEATPEIELYQEVGRVVGDFYANQYTLLAPGIFSEDAAKLPEGQQFEMYTDEFSLGCSDLVLQGNKDFLYTAFWQTQRKWAIARKWLIKLQWDKKLPSGCIHTIKGVRDRHKPMGELLQAYWLLCKECHSLQDSVNVKIPYDNALKWFANVFFDLLLLNMGRVLVPKGTYKIRDNNIKKARIEIERDDLRLLKLGINPFIATRNTVALHVLINTSINLLRESSKFQEDLWDKIYLKAMGAYINEIKKKEWGMNIVENGKHYVQDGRGHGKIFKGFSEDYKKVISTSLTG